MPVGDASLMKSMNRTLILAAIRKHAPIWRTDVSRITGLNKSTVSVLTAELVEEGYVIELGMGDSRGGRKPRLISFNGMAGLVIGVQLSADYTYAVLYNLLGEAIDSSRASTPYNTRPIDAVSGVMNLVDGLVEAAPKTKLGILGVGVGIPGTVDETKERVALSANLGWKDVPFRHMLADALGLRVYIENEANAAALGEKYFGVKARSLLYVHLDSGVGAGIVIDGQLFTGRRGIAGEVGHMVVEAKGVPCVCGNKGCWERYVSVKAVREKCRDMRLDVDEDISSIAALASSGDKTARDILTEVGEYLGVGLTTLVNTFDPDVVSLGGSLMDAGKWVLEPAIIAVRERCLSRDDSVPVFIGISPLGKDACALGAACILIEEHFNTLVTGG